MKKILYAFFALFLLTFAACKKDEAAPLKAFEDIVYADIQKAEANFSDQDIVVSSAAEGDILKAGSVVFYKTNLGVLGKFKIVNIDAENLLTIDLVNYNSNGTEIKNKKGLTIKATWHCDLDNGLQSVVVSEDDFKWDIQSATDKAFVSDNSAIFYVYSK